jgi:polygalacturonase
MKTKKVLLSGLLIFMLFVIAKVTVAQSSVEPYSWNNLPKIQQPVFKKDTFNITSYGAVSDGLTLNTKSINTAIIDCSKKGGGVVKVPAGFWLTGPLIMQSNVNLYLERAAIIQFTEEFNRYPLVEGNYEGRRSARNQSPLSGTNIENVAITGSGVIDGNGDYWRMISKERLTESQWKKKVASGGLVGADGRMWMPSEKAKKGLETKNNGEITEGKTLKDFEDIKDFLRPNMIVFVNCKKVLLEGVTFQNSPAWCLHPLMCTDLTVRNAVVNNPENAQNGDGIDVESCKNVLIEGSTFECGDDGICIKSGRDEEGRKRAMPTENVIVRNNIVYHAHGGFVIGSEMSGGARNIFVYDCSFMGTDKGLRFKTARGRGGIVEKIFVKNIFMKNIVGEAIYFDMYYFTKPPAPGQKVEIPAVTEATPQFQDFEISNVVCNGAEKGIFLRGLPEMSVKNISLSDIVLKTNNAIEIIEASNIRLNNIQVISKQTKPVVYIESSSNISINSLKYTIGADLLFSINGERTKAISVTNTDIKNAKEKFVFVNGGEASALQIK